MEAVANELGVDRKAVNYRVSDRNNLVKLVAVEALRTELAELRLDVGLEWQDSVRQFANGLKEACLSTGELISYLRFESE